MKKMVRWLCVLLVCVSGSLSQVVVVPAHAKQSDDPLHDLLLATAQAPMDGSLRGALQKILDSARHALAKGHVEEAAEELAAYLALLEAQKGAGITPAAADALIAAADEALPALFPYPFAADYDRVPIAGGSASGGGTVDWRTKGVVTGVTEQGQCTSDHAFSATGAAESAWGIGTGQLHDLSEQQLIDCDRGNDGCEGGSPVSALEYGLAARGFVGETSYPYTAQDGTCKASSSDVKVTITGLARTTPGDEGALQFAVQNVGPVSAILRIRGSAWDAYTGGLFDPATAASGVPRYVAVLVVGFGEQGGIPYWLVKTSNGTDWGEAGYVRIPRGQNALGIADYVVYPIV